MRNVLMAVIAAMVLAACAPQPIYQVNNVPATKTGGTASAEEVKAAIMLAGAALGWQMKPVKPGLIIGTLILRTHTAVVEIPYSADQYSILYKDSADLKYDGTTIHKSYNRWIQNLNQEIRNQLRV
jgi:uncharacterized lipoprotein YmbA